MENRGIEKKRFLKLKESICILDVMVHSGNKYKTIIHKEGTVIAQNIIDETLTEEIDSLKKAVEMFEQNTGLKIKII